MTAVLHVITGLGMGGAERMLVHLASSLQARGIPQHVVSVRARDAYADELEAHGISVTALDVRSTFGGIGGLRRLTGLVRQVRPRVIQGWMYHGNVLSALAYRMMSRRLPCKLYWNLRASNMDDARYGWIIRAGALLSHWPDMVIANSQVGLAYHIGCGFRPRRFEVIPNGIDVDLFRPDPDMRAKLRGELGIDLDAVVAIHIARVDPMKDHGSFLEAMGRCSNIVGLLVGTGTERLVLPHNVWALGPRRDVAALCACADLIVSTSAFGEGFSNVIAEGMSTGLVPVVTDVGDSRLIVGPVGHVVAPGSVDDLATAIAAEAELSRMERKSRGALARARIVKNFTLENCVNAYARLYAAA